MITYFETLRGIVSFFCSFEISSNNLSISCTFLLSVFVNLSFTFSISISKSSLSCTSIGSSISSGIGVGFISIGSGIDVGIGICSSIGIQFIIRCTFCGVKIGSSITIANDISLGFCDSTGIGIS